MTRNVLAVGLLCAACCAAGYVRGSALRKRGAVFCLRNRPKRPPANVRRWPLRRRKRSALPARGWRRKPNGPPPLPGTFRNPQPPCRRTAGVHEEDGPCCRRCFPPLRWPACWLGAPVQRSPWSCPAAPKLLPLPPELARLPEAPPPLAPGYGRGASVMVSRRIFWPARDYGGYCRNLRAQAEPLLAVEKGREGRP